MEKAVTELIIDFDTCTEEEGPYEALYNAVSCHSLDSTASGRSSDRDSMNKEIETTGARTAGVRPVRVRAEPPGGCAGSYGCWQLEVWCRLMFQRPEFTCCSFRDSVLSLLFSVVKLQLMLR